jgi:hypothetical protein
MLQEDISDIANAVRLCTLSKGKETVEQQFLQEVFSTLPKGAAVLLRILGSRRKMSPSIHLSILGFLLLNIINYLYCTDVQMEVLIQCSRQTTVLFEKCQCMLLLVKLHPDIINQKNGVGVVL